MKKIFIVLIIALLSFAIVACSKSNAVYEEMIQKGLQEIEKENYVKAEGFFEMALEEKQEDKQASLLLKQTKHIQQAEKKYDIGNLEATEDALAKVIYIVDGSDLLVQKAEDMSEQIQELKSKEEAFLVSYDNAKAQLEKREYDESLQTIEGVLQQDLSHHYYTNVKLSTESLKEEVIKAKDDAIAEAEAKEKAEEEKKAAELKAQKEREAASKDLGAMKGYWLSGGKDMACHITNTYYACAVRQSDVMFQDNITNIEHINDTEKNITLADGNKATFVLVEKNVLQAGERLYRATKEEANGIYEGYYELP